VYEGGELNVQAAIRGPAIIEEPTTTIVIPPGCDLEVNEFGDYGLSLAY
jgi:N-methylhydantoinase A